MICALSWCYSVVLFTVSVHHVSNFIHVLLLLHPISVTLFVYSASTSLSSLLWAQMCLLHILAISSVSRHSHKNFLLSVFFSLRNKFIQLIP